MVRITKNWYELLKDQFESEYFKDLQKFLTSEYATFTIYPKAEDIFNSMNYVKYADVKVVIIGQDPYHEPGQAHGLCFSVKEGTSLPPSLVNIYKEIKSDTKEESITKGDLSEWARQGILLLNTVLTVRRGQANSHKGKGWELFTESVINLLNKRTDPIIFLLWGANARSFSKMIDKERHYVLECAHPSPLSAYNGFFGCKHFSKTNNILKKLNKEEIRW